MSTRPPLTAGPVARLLGITTQALRHPKLEAALKPTRTASGVRLYDPDVVARVAAERAAAKAAKTTATNPTAIEP